MEGSVKKFAIGKFEGFSAVALIAFLVEVVASIAMVAYLWISNLLPIKYLLVVTAAFAMILGFQGWLMFNKKGYTFLRVFSFALSVLMLILSAFGLTMLGVFHGSLSHLNQDDVEIAANAVNVDQEPFVIYLSGMDTRGSGDIAEKGLSDVNMVIVVNPKTSKILMINTPRDYYVALDGDPNKMDKLTHAGSRGVDCSMRTLEALYDIKFNYYVKVNFKSVVDVVDAVGGITVTSDYNFSSVHSLSKTKYSFVKGENNLNGDAALAFARERKSFAAGDRQRGIHQQKVISAIINKVASPSLLNPARVDSLLDSFTKNTKTNISYNEISKLVKFQLNKMPSWQTQSISVDGTGSYRTTYSYSSQKLYVMIPNQETVDAAKAAIAECIQ